MPFSLFYGAGDIFRATNLNALLKTTRCLSELTKSLKKLTRHWTMAAISPVVLWLQFPSLRGFFETRRLFERES